MHIENELVEYVSPVDQEYKETVEGYKEEVLIPEFSEPPVTDIADAAPTQGKPRCMTFILLIDIFVMHLRCRNYMETT
jgi:hypothetical protein